RWNGSGTSPSFFSALTCAGRIRRWTTLYDNRVQSSSIDEDRFTAQFDLTYDLPARGIFSGKLKTGVKYRTVERERDVTQFFLRPYLRGENPAVDDPSLFATTDGNQILLANFLQPADGGDFFDGLYDFLPGTPELRATESASLEGVDVTRLNELFGSNYAASDRLSYDGQLDPTRALAFYNLYRDRYDPDPSVDAEDYFGDEAITAAYAMATVNLGKKVTLLGGARYEQTTQRYTSVSATPLTEDAGGPGTVDPVLINADIVYDDFLPMFHVKYAPTNWMDVRGAVTQTLSRPNFQSLVPWEFVNANEQSIRAGNPDLEHTTATNYDIFLSFYNKFGLFTLGGFRKDLRNVDFIQASNFIDPDNPNNLFNGFSVSRPANVPEGYVEGIEIDLQGNLLPLRNPLLSGVVFGANATVLRSETQYPLIINIPERPNPNAGQPGEPFFLPAERIDSFRLGRIVGQPDLIVNLMLGYEKKGFSGRISAVYQGDALSPGNPGIGSGGNGVGDRAEEDAFDASFWRMDLAFRQKIGKEGNLSVIFNVNNVLNTPEQAFLTGTGTNLLTENEFFGVTADLGVAWKFRKE
ncbi:MAG: TonB-dependent receptor, partial [Bacteroidota bacterium]